MDKDELASKLTDLHIKVLKEILRGESYPHIKEKYHHEFEVLNYEQIIIHQAHRLTFDADDNVIGAYPVSPLPTPHKITVAGVGTGYAMCAIDALGAAHTFQAPVSIESSTTKTQQPVNLVISPTEPAPSSDQVVAFNQLDYASLQDLVAANAQLAVDACPSINFYDTRDDVPEHLTALDFPTAVTEARTIFDYDGIRNHILQSLTMKTTQ